jgi:hypothetical protein
MVDFGSECVNIAACPRYIKNATWFFLYVTKDGAIFLKVLCVCCISCIVCCRMPEFARTYRRLKTNAVRQNISSDCNIFSFLNVLLTVQHSMSVQ